MRRPGRLRKSLLGAAALALATAALADEGFWPFEHVPRELIATRRGVTLDDSWLSRAQLAGVRLVGGCSATFVSPRGLMITSRQCVESCLGENTTASANLARDGFASRSPIEEKRCRRMRGQVLLGSDDITGQIALATAGLEPTAAAGARDRELARLEQACEQNVDPKARPVDCEAAALHDGGEYRLYKYLDFDDLRLSFVSERAVAQLSGDAFGFPRLAFDVAFLRAYAEGKPIDSPAFARVNFAGPAEREPLFVAGHPHETARNTAVAELLSERDTVLKNEMLDAAELRGRYTQFAATSTTTREHIAVPLLRLERELAWRDAMFTALLSESQLAAKLAGEATLRQRISADPELKLSAGSAFDQIAAAQAVF
ncbi:MAG: S46 family peptidase, partial [Steroidobacterales bacterium]